ncbi:G-protein-signaling modulator 1-like [Ambystoma mexicanum]|uniref:G-protein-signaling modulator 1-like n=1 Tax=Ambystoma mexicanum TaxID=8296 RepID=UPI0037E8B56F
MEDDPEDKAESPRGPPQEAFHYFSISSGPEASLSTDGASATATQGCQGPVNEVTLPQDAGMQETNTTVHSEMMCQGILRGLTPRQHMPSPDTEHTTDEGRSCRSPEEGPMCSSEQEVESECLGELETQPDQRSMYLEEEERSYIIGRDDESSYTLGMAEDNCHASQMSLDHSDAETFFAQICHFQSRRMNDQRCSFRKKRRGDDRPWQSAPSTPTNEGRTVFFSSTMSLQTEEFFDLVAWAQAHRLDDQRADFLEQGPVTLVLCAPPPGKKMADQQKLADEARERREREEEEKERRRKQSRRHSTGAPRRAPDEALYTMILTHQAARIEDQRTEPPIPADAENLFELLLRLQGARMEEQRTELPIGLQQRKFSMF